MDTYGRGKERPYNELPPLPPIHAIETPRTLKKAVTASRALAELKSSGQLIPNQAILVRSFLLQEARTSSEIENIVTTNDELYRAFSASSESSDPATKEVLQYEKALWFGFQALQSGRRIDGQLATEIAQIIIGPTGTIRQQPGTKITNRQTGEVVYWPPTGEQTIREMLANLSEFLYLDESTDPLIKMAVTHYQFEAIHPFPDGNGRTGRVLNILALVAQRLLDLPVLYLSRTIIRNKASYYRLLRAVTEEDAWEDWIWFMLDAVEQTAIETLAAITQIRQASASAAELAKAKMARGYSRELIDLIFQQPYTRIAFLETAGIAKRQAASEYLRELEGIGLLEGRKVGREMLYWNRALGEALGS